MADSAEIISGLTIFLQKKASERLRNSLFNVMPTLEFLFALSGQKTGDIGLGRPKGLMVSALKGVAAAQREKIFAERVYLPLIQKSKPSTADAKAMTDYDNDPSVPAWDTTNRPLQRYTQPRAKFCRVKMPYKVPHSDVRTAVAGGNQQQADAVKALGTVYNSEVMNREAVLCELLNDMLFDNGTWNGVTLGQPTDEDQTTWDTLPSIQTALSATNTYCGIDRAVAGNEWWQGNTVSAATAANFTDIIEYCDYDLGMARKGGGVGLIACGATLFKIAKAEARSNSYQLYANGIPEFPEWGFKREVVRFSTGNRFVYIYYDPAMPASSLACLDPTTWTVAIHPQGNFKISTPSDQTKVEAGDEADTGTIAFEGLLVCEDPALNAWFSNVS